MTLRCAAGGLLLALALAACAPAAAPTPTADTGINIVEPPVPVQDFTLVNQAGQETHLADVTGKYTLLAFGYTHCPDVCPITLAHFKQIRMRLKDQAGQVNFVWVSVDGARDTPERLTQYIANFDSAIIGLTGPDDQVRAFISQFGGVYFLNNAGGLKKNYTVDHTASWFLLNPQGQWLRTYRYATPPDVVAQDIAGLIAGARL